MATESLPAMAKMDPPFMAKGSCCCAVTNEPKPNTNSNNCKTIILSSEDSFPEVKIESWSLVCHFTRHRTKVDSFDRFRFPIVHSPALEIWVCTASWNKYSAVLTTTGSTKYYRTHSKVLLSSNRMVQVLYDSAIYSLKDMYTVTWRVTALVQWTKKIMIPPYWYHSLVGFLCLHSVCFLVECICRVACWPSGRICDDMHLYIDLYAILKIHTCEVAS